MFSRLKPEQRQALKERYLRWRNLPLKKRQEIRRLFRNFKKLSPEQRQQLIKRYRQWQSLTPAQRQYIRNKLRQRRRQ